MDLIWLTLLIPGTLLALALGATVWRSLRSSDPPPRAARRALELDDRISALEEAHERMKARQDSLAGRLASGAWKARQAAAQEEPATPEERRAEIRRRARERGLLR